jgi:hypothetical protein
MRRITAYPALPSRVLLCSGVLMASVLVASGPTAAAVPTASVTIPPGNLVLNPSFEVPDPVSMSGGTRGWTGTVYPPLMETNAVVQSVPLATAPDGGRVAQVSLNLINTGSEFGMHNLTPTVQSTRAGVAYRASATLAAASTTSLGKTAKLQLREFAPGNLVPVQTQETSVSLTAAFQSASTSLTVQHTGDSVDVYVLQEGAAFAHRPVDSFYADVVSMVVIGQPAFVNVPVPAGPTAIATGCSLTSPDVTIAFNAWLATVPDFSAIQFPSNACYHLEGILVIFGRHNLVVAGNGAQLQAFTKGVTAAKPTGTDPDVLQLPKAWPSHRSAVIVMDSTDLTVRGLSTLGPNTACNTMWSTLPIDTNGQSGFEVTRSNRILLDQDRVKGFYGDLVAVTQGSDQVTVQGGDFECSGNVGMHMNWATNIVFSHNTVVEGGAASFSMEPMRDVWIIQHIVVDNNDVYPNDPNWSTEARSSPIRDLAAPTSVTSPSPTTGYMASLWG